MDNKLFLRVPNAYVRNENGVSLNGMDFALFCVLKHESFKEGGQTFEVDTKALRQVIDIVEAKTLKKSLTNLYVAGAICEEVTKLPKRGPLTIRLSDDAINGKPFTRLPVGVLRKIHTIGHTGLRLLFYYESHINRGSLKKNFCFSSFKSISDKLSISEPTIWKYNDILEKENLLTIERSTIGTDYSYREVDAVTDRLVYTKYNNHYTPRLEKM